MVRYSHKKTSLTDIVIYKVLKPAGRARRHEGQLDRYRNLQGSQTCVYRFRHGGKLDRYRNLQGSQTEQPPADHIRQA